MAANIPIEPQDGQKGSVWAWNSINSFVENTKTASESFFDNVTSTLAKKPDAKQNENNVTNQMLALHKISSSKPVNEVVIEHDIKPEAQEWKSRYMQLKHAHTLKTGMLQNELQKYKDKNISFNRHISIQTEAKIAKLESQIIKYEKNESQCMHILNENMRDYYQNMDHLEHEIENKYKIFYEKLLNVTVKSGLNPNDIFEINDINHKPIRNLITEYQNTSNDDNISVASDFEEKQEQIHNAEECTAEECTNKKENKIHKSIQNEYKITEFQSKLDEYDHTKYDTQIAQLSTKLSESEASLSQYKNKFLDLVEKNGELKQNNTCLTQKVAAINLKIETQKEQYDELEALFSSMSDQNTDFQQQIKDVEGENALLRQQLNEYKTHKQQELDALIAKNETANATLHALGVRHTEINHKLENEYEISQQLREQIKAISKTLSKKTKSNIKQKKKMEAMDKKLEELQYITQEQQRKITKYTEQIRDLESEQRKYNNAITQYKSLQQEIEAYIDENYELRNKLNDIQNELSTNKQHGDEIRQQSKRDTKNISRLTHCNEELVCIIKQCEDILIENAHQYLPISLINAQELECTDSEDEDDYKHTLVSDDNQLSNKSIIYFDDSDSEKEEDDDDDIMKAAKEKDLCSLQKGMRLKIQISMLAEQLAKFEKDLNHFKRELHRKEEESMRQQHELRQIAIQKRLHAQVRKELGKRERDMVAIASVRGLNMRHKTSLKKLTQTQDKVKMIMNRIQEKDASFKQNISMQLSQSMDINDNMSTASSVQSGSKRKHYNPFYEEDDDVFKLEETQSMLSYKSDQSKSRSVHSQSAISLNTHYRHNGNRNKSNHKYKMKRSKVLQPMQTVQAKNDTDSNKSTSKNPFGSSWF